MRISSRPYRRPWSSYVPWPRRDRSIGWAPEPAAPPALLAAKSIRIACRGRLAVTRKIDRSRKVIVAVPVVRWLPSRGKHASDGLSDNWSEGPGLSLLAHLGMFAGVCVFTFAYLTSTV